MVLNLIGFTRTKKRDFVSLQCKWANYDVLTVECLCLIKRKEGALFSLFVWLFDLTFIFVWYIQVVDIFSPSSKVSMYFKWISSEQRIQNSISTICKCFVYTGVCPWLCEKWKFITNTNIRQWTRGVASHWNGWAVQYSQRAVGRKINTAHHWWWYYSRWRWNKYAWPTAGKSDIFQCHQLVLKSNIQLHHIGYQKVVDKNRISNSVFR